MPTTTLNADPSRTTVLRSKFVGQMNKRFRAVKGAINELVIDDDAFGLKEPVTFNPMVGNVERQAWRFQTNEDKIKSFQRWLQEQVDGKILTIDTQTGKPWTNGFIESAHQKGVLRGYLDARSADFDIPSDLIDGTQTEFLRDSFTQRLSVRSVQRIATRTFNDLKNITIDMSNQISKILTKSFAEGRGVRVVARLLNKEVDKLTRTRARAIARTEIVHAHAEGQLDAFEALGIEEVGVFAEWSTAGDDRVCAMCRPLQGVVMTIKEARGLIPRHPNCRCAFIPADSDNRQPGQFWSKTKIDVAVGRSAKAERPKSKNQRVAKRGSSWTGSKKKFKTKG